ncbi:hypothetical protein [Atopomonas sediminilitoris]|uniref:hypothetical protein n=1 Tax=Atopomonas sediminilitoris TaxID=2919919 RepID=UPI001F4DAB90|nr:hypothetical protein [Atopomonas sediminilitoris]MCJ8168660.1 hypothetical protein [Atopomonas sediminilitoris]
MLTTTQTFALLVLIFWFIAWPATCYWLGQRQGRKQSHNPSYAKGLDDGINQAHVLHQVRWRSQRNEIEQLKSQLAQAREKLASLMQPYDERDADTLRHISRELSTLAGTYEGFNSHQRAAETRTLVKICQRLAERITPATEPTTELEAAA